MVFLLLMIFVFSGVFVTSSQQSTCEKQVFFHTFSTGGQQLAVRRDQAVVQKRVIFNQSDSSYQAYGKLTKALYVKIAHFFQPGSQEWMTLCLSIPLNKTLIENIALHSAWYIHNGVAQGSTDVLYVFFKKMERAFQGYKRSLMVVALQSIIQKLFVKKSRSNTIGCLWWNPILCLLIDEPHMVSELVAQKAAITSPIRGLAFLYTGFYFLRHNNKKVYHFPLSVERHLPDSLQKALFLKKMAPLLRCCCLSGPVWCCMAPITIYSAFMLYVIFSNFA